MLSIKNLIFKERLAKKLVDYYVRPYININQYGQITTACFNENPSSGKCQLNSTIQGASERTEERRSEISKGMGSRKNIK